jgi:hypothetical protein
MPQSPRDRIAELHSLAGHTHFAAAVAHRKQDHQTAHELSVRANEYSADAHRQSELLLENSGKELARRRQ